jgi:prophage regulatory protein
VRLLRLPDIIARVGLRRSAIYERIALGTFPRPVKIGERAIAFLEEEIEEWLRTRPRAAEKLKRATKGSRLR